MRNRLLTLVEQPQVKKEPTAFQIGDQVEVHQIIQKAQKEGESDRIQVYAGVVIARKGDGLRAMFTVRKMVQSEGVERIFPLHSPNIAKIVVKRTGKVRRAKLYYLRKRVGKAMRLRERTDHAAATAAATKKAAKAAAAKEVAAAKAAAANQ